MNGCCYKTLDHVADEEGRICDRWHCQWGGHDCLHLRVKGKCRWQIEGLEPMPSYEVDVPSEPKQIKTRCVSCGTESSEKWHSGPSECYWVKGWVYESDGYRCKACEWKRKVRHAEEAKSAPRVTVEDWDRR